MCTSKYQPGSYRTKSSKVTKGTKLRIRMFEMKMQVREYFQQTFLRPFKKQTNVSPSKHSKPRQHRKSKRPRNDLSVTHSERKFVSDVDHNKGQASSKRNCRRREKYASDSLTTNFSDKRIRRKNTRSSLTKKKSDLVDEMLDHRKQSTKSLGDGDDSFSKFACIKKRKESNSSCTVVTVKEPVTKTKKKKYKTKSCQASLDDKEKQNVDNQCLHKIDLIPPDKVIYPNTYVPSTSKSILLRIGEFIWPEVPRRRKKNVDEIPPKLLRLGFGVKAKWKKPRSPRTTSNVGQDSHRSTSYSHYSPPDNNQSRTFTSKYVQYKSPTSLKSASPYPQDSELDTYASTTDSFASFFRNLKNNFLSSNENDEKQLTSWENDFRTSFQTGTHKLSSKSYFKDNLYPAVTMARATVATDEPSNNPLLSRSQVQSYDRDPYLFFKTSDLKTAFTAKFKPLLDYKIDN